MDALLDSIRGMDPRGVLIVGGVVSVACAYIARWWWTAPIVNAVERVEDALRRRP